MAHPVLVRSSMRTWDYTLLLIAGAILLIGGGVTAVFGKLLLCLLLAVPGLGIMIWALVGRSGRVRLLQWVQDQADGFLIIDHKGERRFADRDVLAMGL